MAESIGSMNRRRHHIAFSQSLIERIKKSQDNFQLVWFDPNIKPEEVAKKAEELRVINDQINVFFHLEKCMECIKSIKDEKIFLITSGSQAPEILSQVMTLDQVDSIFIFCMAKDKYAYLLTKYNRVVGIYTKFDELCGAIEEEFDNLNKRIETFSCFKKDDQYTNDLSKESAKFLWYQMFNYVIARVPRNQQAQEQMIQLCKNYFHTDAKEMKNIQEFEQTYRSEDAIYWYSKKSFLFKIVNKVLRIESIELIHAFRNFICDLSENLQRQHEKMLSLKEKVLVLYRGSVLNTKEFDRLKQSQGKLISTNGYLSTSRKKSQAIEYASRPSKRNDVVRVLFHIKINLEKVDRNIIFADITELSDNPDEAEVLFDINACFEVESFQEDEPFQTIQMKLSNQGQRIAKDFVESSKKEIEGATSSIVIGRLLYDLGEYDESQKYFEQLLDSSTDEDRAWIEFNIGRALDGKGQLKEAAKYYSRAYKRMMEDGPQRLKDAARVLNRRGEVHYRCEEYDEALKDHRMALEIQEQYDPTGHADIAKSLLNIGKTLTHKEKHKEALDYYQKATTVYETFCPSGCVDLAKTLNSIGVYHEKQNNKKLALDYFQRAMTLNFKTLPVGHDIVQRTKDAIRRLNATK